MSDDRIQELEQQLDSFDIAKRKEALKELLEMVGSGKIELAKVGSDVNLHIHSFYSYNACGYSPTKIAWLAKKAGLAVAGTVASSTVPGFGNELKRTDGSLPRAYDRWILGRKVQTSRKRWSVIRDVLGWVE